MKEKILEIVQRHIKCTEKCIEQSEEDYEDGDKDGVARYHYWDGAHDTALAIEREIKNLYAVLSKN